MTRQRHIVLTGGASGIGAAALALFKADGDRVTVIDRNDPGPAADRWINADLSDLASIAALESLSRIDVLVNAAGLPPRPGLEWTILRVNTQALIALTEHLLPHLTPGGAIVNMASKAGGKWRENLAQVQRFLALDASHDLDAFLKEEAIDPVRAYDLSKEAVIAWGLSNIERFRDLGLRINSVSPAAVDTPILEDFMTAFGARATRGVDLTGRAGRPDEIAEGPVGLRKGNGRGTGRRRRKAKRPLNRAAVPIHFNALSGRRLDPAVALIIFNEGLPICSAAKRL
ncbi:SDR family NAD(P)-dependent oxidoreductase [Marivita sp.]|uniref:SDR family NAD(P)-dependent oxidoreductase n=1 Tax=Marivita sp. TaxID=2003365 RepID=UPI002612506D|nr:SDR family NAD(P)-dependent oxidoreductase [Marivita sp.]